jgi:hypothetical protein
MRREDAPDRFVLVTIIEERPVRGMFGPGNYFGYRAKGDDGRFYTCNWGSFPDDSTTPTWMWYRDMPAEEINEAVKNEDACWYDVTQGMPYIKTRPIWLERYTPFITYCPLHQRLYYDLCFWCEHDPLHGIPEPDHTWKGWY